MTQPALVMDQWEFEQIRWTDFYTNVGTRETLHLDKGVGAAEMFKIMEDLHRASVAGAREASR